MDKVEVSDRLLEDRVKRLEDTLSDIYDRVQSQKIIIDSVHSIAVSVEKQTSELHKQGRDLEELTHEIKDIKKNKILYKYIPILIVSILLTAIITYLIVSK